MNYLKQAKELREKFGHRSDGVVLEDLKERIKKLLAKAEEKHNCESCNKEVYNLCPCENCGFFNLGFENLNLGERQETIKICKEILK